MIDQLIGTKLGDFTIIERIGQGGTATVYRAEQSSMKREVALKVINVMAASEHGDFYKRFEREASVIASLEHTSILPIHDYGIQGNWAYMAMRYLRGGTLKDRLRKGRIPLEQVLDLFSQIAGGLAHAHSKGVIHRDIKPANILLDEAGNAFLTDFGLAKIVKGEPDSTQTGQIVGTITNMAPEQLRGDPIDHRADIYGLGTVLYEMAVGATPFKTESTSDIIALLYKHLEDDPEPPRSFDPTIPPELEATILKAIAKRPDQRFDSVADMLETLTSLRSQAPSSTITLPPVNASLVARSQEIDSVLRAHRRIHRLNNNPIFITVVVAVVVILFFVGLVVINDQFINQSTALMAQSHTVLTGISTTSSEIIPSIDQIELAQNALDEDEFIGIIACNLSSEYHATLNREMRSFLLEAGIDNKVYNSDSDAFDQIPLLEQALAEGAQGIILCPLDYSLLDAPLQTIEASRIPFVSITDEENLYGGIRLSSKNDNYSMGYTVGEFAGQIVIDEMNGEASVIILDFPDMEVLIERANGLEEGILSVAPDVEIVGRYLGATAENGQASVENLINNEVDFDVILSINDAGSYGAIDALEDADITPDDVIIVSIDAERQAIEYMRDGRFIRGSLSLSGSREESAHAASDAMILMLAGADIPESILVESGDMVTPEDVDHTEGD